MTTWYCDPSLPIAASYNAAPVAGGTIPTKPDDGDGKASGVAAKASGTITIGTNLNSGDTISFNGKTFTAGTDFTIGANAGATAVNIAAAINALAATSTWTVGNGTQFRDLFNACVSGSVVTVHTRIGSADWNAITITTSSGGRATVSGFSGGASGAFGWFINTTSITWPSGAKAAMTHGVAVAEPVGYVIANGDTVLVRPNATLNFGAVTTNCVLKKRGTSTLPVLFELDDGTIWTADAGLNSVLDLKFNVTASYTVTEFGFSTAASSVTDGGVTIRGKQYSNGTRNMRVRFKDAGGAVANGIGFAIRLAPYSEFESVEFSDGATANAAPEPGFLYQVQAYDFRAPKLYNCKHGAVVGWGNTGLFFAMAYDPVRILWQGGEFAWSGMVAAPTNTMVSAPNPDVVAVKIIGAQFNGLQPGAKIFNSTNYGTERSFELIDCDGAENFSTLHAAAFCRTVTGTTMYRKQQVLMSGIRGNGYVLDSVVGHASWLPGLGYPYLNGLVEEDRPASVRFEPTSNTSVITPSGIQIFDTLVFNASDTAASKMLTSHVAIDEAMTLDSSQLAMHVEYTDNATGKVKTATTLVPNALAAPLTTDTATWYPEDGGRPYYTEGVAKYYNKRKFAVTTPTSVKPNSMLRVWLSIHVANAAVGRYLFVDPYIEVV